MQIIFSKEFRRQFERIKDANMQKLIAGAIEKLEVNPECGKPLMYNSRNYRRLRISSFRLIYRIESEAVVILMFDKRKTIYKKLAKYINYNVFYI